MLISVFANSRIERKSQVEAAVEILNSSQSSIYFRLSYRDDVPCLKANSVICPHVSRKNITDSVPDVENIAIITDCELENNWFSMTSKQGTIISTGSWEKLYSPPALKTYRQMELILHSVACFADMTDDLMESMSHHESIGCLFDFCQHKQDVRFKIIGGHLCDACSGKLLSYGMNLNMKPIIGHMLDVMRLDSIGRATKIKFNTVFTAMRFSKNNANEHSFLYGVLPAFKAFGIDAQRADSIPESGILIEKIFRMIDEAWATIVISGEDNLNVFFEYGYAVGRGKPIFLVTPTSKIFDTPTDIKGLEHIVYQDGDFEGLKAAITSRLKSLPRFSTLS